MIGISEILTKLKIKYEDLNVEERQTYTQWEQVLRGEMTMEKVRGFLQAEVDRIEMEWSVPDNSKEKDNFLKAEMRVLKTLIAFMSSPERSKEFLEQHMTNLFKKIE